MAVYRNTGTLDRIRRMLLMLVVVGLGMGLVGLGRAVAGGPGPSLWSGVGLSVVGLASLGLIRRTHHVAVETGPEGIVVRNLFSTQRLAWSEIEGIEEGPRRRGITTAFVRTASGKVHALAGVGDPGTTSAKIVRSLEKELKAARRG
jgi:hypothetical protein